MPELHLNKSVCESLWLCVGIPESIPESQYNNITERNPVQPELPVAKPSVKYDVFISYQVIYLPTCPPSWHERPLSLLSEVS